ncbi:glutamate ABC transporter substrate-binding protein [Corynebacterium stationis]|jgi:glutamate transport system substrate-binding protein|uniref:Glutamate ABC transporter substrate-binding protein n=1 Tax=Corynebacterium stationis TaxID=1705 RepID=A0A177IAK4_9CORY|nr:glutamate ABC transporter substrate-binding protein [Corynebacterium stationis]NME88124.1 glutamate ABC transporter substrate-binding protein [Corynebacterium stationis]OAH25125.1 glutamate-binding protein [Corynebacterium stationis]WLP86833.1 glutamate ABC transporter substrate-binding protein [Corynebacterium stationis]HCM80662.1 glutamate-binding protein [Corynebacterium stationis]HHT59700.1 glutamate ABC transporter substrate-binding protein [Corynebacterium stationis]
MSRSITRIAAIIGTVAVSGSLLAACGGSSGDSDGLLSSIESGNVTLGTKFDQPGLGLREPDGSMTGLDVEVATYVVNSIAAENGWDEPSIDWRETPSAQRETLIQNGEVDMITATYSINPGRSESVNFGGPYLLTHQALLVQDSNNEINGLDDLEGKILCSVTGSTPAQKVKEALPTVQLQEYDTYSSCTEALRQGNVDAMTTDATILNGYAAQSPGNFRVVELEKDGEPFTNEYYGIGLAKDDTEGTDAINTALEAMFEDGSFDKFISDNLGEGEAITKGTPGDLSFMDE